jgi:hypothetical protein
LSIDPGHEDILGVLRESINLAVYNSWIVANGKIVIARESDIGRQRGAPVNQMSVWVLLEMIVNAPVQRRHCRTQGSLNISRRHVLHYPSYFGSTSRRTTNCVRQKPIAEALNCTRIIGLRRELNNNKNKIFT